jgi:hypothetical protein
MGRKRTLNYRELRSYDDEGGEGRKKDEEELEEEEEEEEEDEDEEASESEDEEEEEEGEEDEDEESAKPAKKKKAAPKAPKAPKPAKPKRTRAGKVIRLRVVWGVFDNSNRQVAKFDYPKRHEAEAHATKLGEEKKGQTFFVQPVKEPIAEEK